MQKVSLDLFFSKMKNVICLLHKTNMTDSTKGGTMGKLLQCKLTTFKPPRQLAQVW